MGAGTVAIVTSLQAGWARDWIQ